MNKLNKLTIALVIAITAMAGVALADFTQPDISKRDITVNGSGAFEIRITTDHANETHRIEFDTNNDSVVANLTGNGVDTGEMNVKGNGTWTPESVGTYNFTLNVSLLPDAIPGDEYPIYVEDTIVVGGCAKTFLSSTTASITAWRNGSPLPETATIVLISIGLIGLIAVAGRKK